MSVDDLRFKHATIAPPTFFTSPDRSGIPIPGNRPGMWIHQKGKTGVYINGVITVKFDSAGHVIQFETDTRVYTKE